MEFLSVADMMKLLRISYNAAHRLAYKLRHVRIEGGLRVYKDSLLEYLETCTNVGPKRRTPRKSAQGD